MVSDFNPKNYQIVFEEAIRCSQFRQVFQSFLEKHHNQESILFINRIVEYTEEYKKFVGIPSEIDAFSLILKEKDYQRATSVSSRNSKRNTFKFSFRRCVESLYEMMNSIVKTFLKEGQHELNIGPLQKSTLESWESISQKFKREKTDLASEVSSTLSRTVSNLQFEELHPGNLLGSISLQILVDLSLGHFAKFVRSEDLFQFISKMGLNYTRKIGVDISKGFNVDLRFNPKELKSPIITDEHIYFGFTLAQDTPDWKVIHEKKNFTISTSRTSYVFKSQQMKNYKLCKTSIDLPYSLENVWKMWTNPKNHIHFESMFAKSRKFHDYIAPNEIINGSACPYGMKIISTEFDTKIPFVKKRYVEIVSTSIKDSALDMYMFISHSAELPSGLAKIPSNCVPIEGLCYYIMMRVNEKTTRFLNIMYTDFHLPMQDLTIGQVFKQRGKEMNKGLNNVLSKLTRGGKQDVKSTREEDDLGAAQQCVLDNCESFPERSWYKEWKGLKN